MEWMNWTNFAYAMVLVFTIMGTMVAQKYRMVVKELKDVAQKYKEASKDKDLESILPAYQTYCALKHGVLTCERKVALQDESLGPVALEYFNLATRFSRTISKD